MDSPNHDFDDEDVFFDASDTFSSPEKPPPPPSPPPPPLPEDTSSAVSPHSVLRRRRSSIDRRRSSSSKTFAADSSVSTLTSEESQPSINTLPPPRQHHSHPGFLVATAALIVKAVFFQLNIFITCLKIPFVLLRLLLSVATDPFGTLKQGLLTAKDWIFWIPKLVVEKFITPYVHKWFRGQEGIGKLALRILWGCFWAIYVGIVLVGLLVSAFVSGSIALKSVIEEPLKVNGELIFDYTKPSPDAVVRLAPHVTDCSGRFGVVKDGSWGVVPPNHRLQLIVSLTLPESDYNWKLGVFQVRAEFLDVNGNVISSRSQPCMLRYKSPHIRFIETFFKSATVLAGYSSESQTLKLRLTSSKEASMQTACIRIVLEQRAEYKPNAGIPEIYAASVKIESELPFLKRILWNWRRTMFIWISMGIYILELSFVLICCRPLIMPRVASYSASPFIRT